MWRTCRAILLLIRRTVGTTLRLTTPAKRGTIPSSKFLLSLLGARSANRRCVTLA